MALYTSYYARQLALRPETIAGGEQNVEGDKTIQKSVARRTIDFTGPCINWLETRRLVRNPSDLPALFGIPSSSLDILPPSAYSHQPISSFPVKFAGQAPSKTRSSVNVVSWTPEGRRCLTGTQAGEFCLWDGQTLQFESIIQAHETPIRALTYTNAGNFLISGDDAGNVRYWRTNYELVKSFSAHRESVRQLSFAPGDLKFASASDDSTVRVWDFARVTEELVLAGHGGDVKCVDWHPSKTLLVSGSKDGLIKLWCPRSGSNIATLHGHKGTITASRWGSNGNWVLTASRDQTCKVYDIRMQAEMASFIGHGKDITYAGWHCIHEEMFVSGGQDGSLCFWLVGRLGPQGHVPVAHEGSIWCAAWHPAGHLLATGASDATTKFWCRGRPGDPFMEQQEAEQAALAALAREEQATMTGGTGATPPVVRPAPPVSSTGGIVVPGIGEALAKQVVAPALDLVYTSNYATTPAAQPPPPMMPPQYQQAKPPPPPGEPGPPPPLQAVKGSWAAPHRGDYRGGGRGDGGRGLDSRGRDRYSAERDEGSQMPSSIRGRGRGNRRERDRDRNRERDRSPQLQRSRNRRGSPEYR